MQQPNTIPHTVQHRSKESKEQNENRRTSRNTLSSRVGPAAYGVSDQPPVA
jgi:hypothetical protein